MQPHTVASSFLVFGLALALSVPLAAQEAPPPPPGAAPPPAGAEQPAPEEPTLQESLQRYHPKTGTIPIGGVAEVALGEGWQWLDGADGRQFLRDLGNQPGEQTLGVALPPDFGETFVFAVYSYSDDGHVDDAETPDYDALLRDMQESTREESKARRAAGVQGVELLGWAEPPHYDQTEHKLYWAERLRFEGEEGDTLNYNVRALGRTGHLVVNGVGDIDQLAIVSNRNRELLAATRFVEGKRYDDFDPGIDKIAAVGIGGLIAGKLALKAGLFAKFGLLLAKFFKPLLAGVVILGGLLWKVFGGRKRARAARSEA